MLLSRIYVLTDGTALSESQCTGLLDVLNLECPVEVKELTTPVSSVLVRWLPSWCQVTLGSYGVARLGDKESMKELASAKGATLVLASGYNTLTTAIELKKALGDKAFTVVIGHPCSFDYSLFDMVILSGFEVLMHSVDPLPKNAFQTEGYVNRATYQQLLRAKLESAETLNDLRHPLLLLNLGGPTKWCPYDEKVLTEDLAKICQNALKSGVVEQVVVVFSDRASEKVQEFYAEQKWLDKWTGDFIYMLAWADLVAVSADSIPECSEVASVGKPLFTIAEESCRASHSSLFTLFEARGVSKPLTSEKLAKNSSGWKYKQLGGAVEAANEVADRLAKAKPNAARKWYRS
ncbi:hypothetical protein BSKO_04913 [Bryopsis sp. KO-2023]|nr:hypothetical protein BSKO_04913 [Bryopsis sp. KO-2023]